MFHLLVAYQGWPDGAGSIPTSRIYIKPDGALGSAFLTGGKLHIAKVSKVPALLVSETGGNGPQFAKVAYINTLTQGPRDTALWMMFLLISATSGTFATCQTRKV